MISKRPRLPSGGNGITMERSITLMNAVCLIVGSIIGSGIFVSPGGVLHYSGTGGFALVIWALCGIICTIGAYCFSELGTMLPAAGGDYAYILHAFGDLPAFLTLWINVMLIRPAAQAIMALAFAEYALALTFEGCTSPKLAVSLLATSALCILTYINCKSVKLAMQIQTIFTSAKLLALAGIIMTGLINVAKGHHMNFHSFFNENQSLGNTSMALYSGLFAYAGWNYVNFVTEELKNPHRNLPRSIWIALPLVTVIYVAANVAYLSVLTPKEIADSGAVAVLFAKKVLGPFQYTVPVFVALSTFGSLNGTLFTSGRLFLAGARQGHLPPLLAFISLRSRTPTPAIIVSCLLSLLMLGGEILWLINYLSFALWLQIGTAAAALLWLRHTKPNAPRPVKVPLALAVGFFVCCVFLVVVPVITEPQSTGLGVLLTLSGVPVYLLSVSWKKKPKYISNFYTLVEHSIQKILLVVEPESSTNNCLLKTSEEC